MQSNALTRVGRNSPLRARGFRLAILVWTVGLLTAAGCSGPNDPICTLMAAHMAHEDGRSTCWEPIVTTPSRCIGISAAQCAKDLYENPVPASSPLNSYTLEFLDRCEDGSTSCPLTEELRCTDGSRPAFYYQPGSNEKWIFFMGGEGGPCRGPTR